MDTADQRLNESAYDLTPNDVAGKKLTFVEGTCQANLHFPKQPRDYPWTMKHIIQPLIDGGALGDGVRTRFDDRKLRYNPPIMNGDDIKIPLGVTHFYAFKQDLERTDEELTFLHQQGVKYFNDQYAFLARAMAVAVLPLTKEGYTVVGERREDQELPGWLNAAAGYVEFRPPSTLHIQEDLFRELGEELGIEKNAVIGEPRFAGAAYTPKWGDTDLVFVVQSDVPAEYFTSGRWKEKVKEREHKNLFLLTTEWQRNRLLQEGIIAGQDKKFPLMSSTRLALESVVLGR